MMQCRWCGDGPGHDDVRCLREERDRLEEYFREAVDALAPYLQAGGRYAFLMSPGEPITKLGPERLVTFLERVLEQSLQLQSHYGELLNTWDGGQRLAFKDAADWIARLRMSPEERMADAEARRARP